MKSNLNGQSHEILTSGFVHGPNRGYLREIMDLFEFILGYSNVKCVLWSQKYILRIGMLSKHETYVIKLLYLQLQ